MLIFIVLSLSLAYPGSLLKAQEDAETKPENNQSSHQDLDTQETELGDELKICQPASLAICTPLTDDLPQTEIIRGRGQLDDKYQSILLLGERVEHSFPRRSFYESVGAFTLNSGRWSLSANGIGGHEDTGASVVSLSWDAMPQACIEQPNGSWANAFQVNCEVRLEWTIQSRYPYINLQLIPIEDDLPQLEIIKGQGQLDGKYPSLLLLGQRIDHSFPRLSFYESVGVFTLNSGSWFLSASGIGGREDTGASAASLSWNAAPQACIEQPKGFWRDANAFRVNCEVRFEWTVQSRYPYTTLELMPIENLLLPKEEP